MENQELLDQLKKNNELLEKIYSIQLKEHRAQVWRGRIHLAIQVLPFIILALVVWYLFRVISANVAALQTNVEALKEFVVGIVPDFSGVGEKLNDVWQDVSFWD